MVPKIFRRKQRDLLSHDSLSKVDPLRAVIAQVSPHIICAYIVGSDHNDYALCKNAPDGVRVMVFEQDFVRCGEMSGLLYDFRGALVWHRSIDDGARESTNLTASASAGNAASNSNVVHDQGVESRALSHVFSGSLDQFFSGTGLPPELIKINTRQSVTSILTGCTEILQLCKPLMMFRLSESTDNDRDKPLHYLSDFGYRIVNTETWEFISGVSMSAEAPSYLLAIHESLSLPWGFTRTEVNFSMSAESVFHGNESTLGHLSLNPGRYVVTCRLQSYVSHSVELILKHKSEILTTRAELPSRERAANLSLMFDVGLHTIPVEISIRTDVGQVDVLDVKAYGLNFLHSDDAS